MCRDEKSTAVKQEGSDMYHRLLSAFWLTAHHLSAAPPAAAAVVVVAAAAAVAAAATVAALPSHGISC